jgi:hypothetical protein
VGQRTFETRSLYLILAEKLFTLPAANEMLPLSALFAGKSRECRQGSADRLGITRRFMPTGQCTHSADSPDPSGGECTTKLVGFRLPVSALAIYHSPRAVLLEEGPYDAVYPIS